MLDNYRREQSVSDLKPTSSDSGQETRIRSKHRTSNTEHRMIEAAQSWSRDTCYPSAVLLLRNHSSVAQVATATGALFAEMELRSRILKGLDSTNGEGK